MSRGFRKSAASGVMASQPTNAQNNCSAARPTAEAPCGANGRNADLSTWPSVRPVTREACIRERERKREQHKGEPGQHGGGTRRLGRDGRQDEDTRPDDSPDIEGGSLPKPESVLRHARCRPEPVCVSVSTQSRSAQVRSPRQNRQFGEITGCRSQALLAAAISIHYVDSQSAVPRPQKCDSPPVGRPGGKQVHSVGGESQ